MKAIAEKAGQDAAKAIEDAAKAQATADDAATAAQAGKDAAAAAQATADQAVADAAAAAANKANTDLSAALERIGKLEQTYVTAEALNAQLEALKNELAEANDIAALAKKIESYDASIAELYSAVTSVSLYVTLNGKIDNEWHGHGAYNLIFPYTVEKTTKFPLDNYNAIYPVDGSYEFTDGVNATLDRDLYIRVSPVSAKLNTEMITLVNSLGEEFNNPELVTVKSVEPYKELITRGGDVENGGIWKITFQLKKGFNEDALDAATKSAKKSIAFAVAVNNTKETAADRMVISEYDVYVGAGPAEPAYEFTVNDVPVADIHNRFYYCEDMTSTSDIEELNWKNSTTLYPTPAVGEKAQDANYSGDRIWGLDGDDNRQSKPILSVIKGEEIVIEFPNDLEALRGFYVTLDTEFALESVPSEINAWTSYEYENVGYKKADGIVVNAKMQDGNKGTITIKDLNNVKGDVIGFRVHAVNLDGTLFDPDGRAFYVRVGDVAEEKTIKNIDVVISGWEESVSEEFNIPEGTFSSNVTSYDLTWGENNPFVNVNGTFYTPVEDTPNQYEPQTSTDPITQTGIYDFQNTSTSIIGFEFYDSKAADWFDINTIAAAGNLDKITKGRAYIRDAYALLDGKTYYAVFNGYQTTGSWYYGRTTEAIENIHISVTKVMPTEIPAGLVKKSGQLANDLLTVYMKPWNDDWTIANKTNLSFVSGSGYTYDSGKFYGKDIYPYDLADIFNGLQRSSVTQDGQVKYNYSWAFNNSDLDGTDNIATISEKGEILSENSSYFLTYAANSGSPFNIINSYMVPFAEESKVGDGEKKSVDAQYTYYNISQTQKRTTGSTVYVPARTYGEDWVVSKDDFFKVQYVCAMNHDANAFKAVSDKTKFTCNYEDNTFDIDLANTTYTAISLPSNIDKSHIGIDESTYKTMADFIGAGYIEILDATIECDYFEVASWTPAGIITLQSTRSTEKPNLTSDQEYKVVVKYADVFGHERSVNIPFYMKKPVASAPRM